MIPAAREGLSVRIHELAGFREESQEVRPRLLPVGPARNGIEEAERGDRVGYQGIHGPFGDARGQRVKPLK